MIEDYLNQAGYRVQSANWTLYNAASAATLTLTGDAPTSAYRLRVTLSAITGHADCSGTLTTNGSETLTFAIASTKITTTNLTANTLPTITTANLDCNILIECLTTGGAVMQEETAKEIDCRFQDTQKGFYDSTGEWSMSQAIAYVSESSCIIGTKLSYDGYDYNIAQVSIMTDLDGSEEGRKLWLTGKSVSPDRDIEVEEGSELLTRYMTKAVYDTDEDGVADKAEGVRDLDALPVSPVEGEIVAKDGKLYVAVS
jgi:hypothetical protein